MKISFIWNTVAAAVGRRKIKAELFVKANFPTEKGLIRLSLAETFDVYLCEYSRSRSLTVER